MLGMTVPIGVGALEDVKKVSKGKAEVVQQVVFSVSGMT